jgi:SAM-dependent methyltransferase
MKKLNFGCGHDIRKDYINVDIVKGHGVDKIFDFNVSPYPFNDNEFDEIIADNVIEHLDSVAFVMKELHRITKNNGSVRIIVPYYNCYGAYNSVTHKHYFSHKAFEGFYNKQVRMEHLGDTFIEEEFKLEKFKLLPTRLGKIFVFDFIIKPLSFIFGQIVKGIDVTLIVKK